VLKCVGLGESRIGERLADFMETGANPTVGTLAHLGQVDVRIAAKAADAEEAERLIAPVEAEIRKRLGDAVFGADADTLEAEIGRRLAAMGTRIALVEVGTAGAATERLAAAIPARFAGSMVMSHVNSAGPLRVDAGRDATPLARAQALALAAMKWGGVEVGAASYVEPLPDSSPPVARAALGVAVRGGLSGHEHTLRGDAASQRIRAATLLLDEIRRALPAER
jgi:nicotinamide-nucleotide amidase